MKGTKLPTSLEGRCAQHKGSDACFFINCPAQTVSVNAMLVSTQASGAASSSTSHTFIATQGPGLYTPYVCAVDTRGARACSESSFELKASDADLNVTQLNSLLEEIGFDSLRNTGDDDAVFDGVSRLAAQLNSAKYSKDPGSGFGATEVKAALQILNDTLTDEGQDVSTAVTAISRQSALRDFVTRSEEENEDSAQTTESALKLIEKGQQNGADPIGPQ
eukprot:scaffold34162_cov15-Tisochrysis_lutea.AAC.1